MASAYERSLRLNMKVYQYGRFSIKLLHIGIFVIKGEVGVGVHCDMAVMQRLDIPVEDLRF